MAGNLKSRIDRLEISGGNRFPHHLPPEQWTDEQLMRFIMVATNSPHELSDAELEAVAKGNA